MKNIIFYSTVLPLSIIGIIAVVLFYGLNTQNVAEIPTTKTDFKNFTVSLNGEAFTLVDGKAEKEYPGGGATKNSVFLFQEPVVGDLDGDGDTDAANLLVNNPGGSGTFYYAVLVMNNDGIYQATNVLFLGDRIAPQTIEIHNGRALFNYAERPAGAMMTMQASMGKSLWINYDKKTGEIGEWVKDFEGEANPEMMSLMMKKWLWVKTEDGAGGVTTPKVQNVFGLTFAQDGNVAVATDCNSMGGSYTTKGNTLTFGNMFSTLMFCEGSQEQEFSQVLQKASRYEFTSKGELLIRSGEGTMYFR